jgi:hypothetical protein
VKRHIFTIAVLALVVGGVAVRGRLSRAPRPSELLPQDAVYAMLDAARAGNVPAYLARYDGALQASLRQSAREMGDAAFAKYLRDSNAAIKGVAVEAPQQQSPAEATLHVEYVYQDRNEAQTMLLRQVGGAWKIARVDGAERVKTLVPYGSPVE